jgi:hypothetical protein
LFYLFIVYLKNTTASFMQSTNPTIISLKIIK